MIDRRPFLPLFVPATRPERIAKAATSAVDAVIADLEDAVAEAQKGEARAALGAALRGPFDRPVFVRVNAVATRHFETDIQALDGLALAGVVLPKAERAEEIVALRSRVKPSAEVWALVESPRGVLAASELAKVSDRLLFGSIDFAASIDGAHRRETLLLARSMLVLVAGAAGQCAPIDGVTTAFDDETLVEDDAAYAASLGFGGKLLIHPRQIVPALRGFAPEADAVEDARRVLKSSDGEAVKLDGRMVDLPVVNAARSTIARSKEIQARIVAASATAPLDTTLRL